MRSKLMLVTAVSGIGVFVGVGVMVGVAVGWSVGMGVGVSGTAVGVSGRCVGTTTGVSKITVGAIGGPAIGGVVTMPSSALLHAAKTTRITTKNNLIRFITLSNPPFASLPTCKPAYSLSANRCPYCAW
jgi:hypothetical protein